MLYERESSNFHSASAILASAWRSDRGSRSALRSWTKRKWGWLLNKDVFLPDRGSESIKSFRVCNQGSKAKEAKFFARVFFSDSLLFAEEMWTKAVFSSCLRHSKYWRRVDISFLHLVILLLRKESTNMRNFAKRKQFRLLANHLLITSMSFICTSLFCTKLWYFFGLYSGES